MTWMMKVMMNYVAESSWYNSADVVSCTVLHKWAWPLFQVLWLDKLIMLFNLKHCRSIDHKQKAFQTLLWAKVNNPISLFYVLISIWMLEYRRLISIFFVLSIISFHSGWLLLTFVTAWVHKYLTLLLLSSYTHS